MKKLLLLCLLIFFTIRGIGQINQIDLILLTTETDVTQYFNLLNSKKPNQYFKVEMKITASGDLMLVCMFWIEDEPFFKCLAITAAFDRVDGKEYCVSQTIMGSEEYANYHLGYVKDNFKVITPGRWERPLGGNNKLKIVANFKRINGETPMFEITYEIQNE